MTGFSGVLVSDFFTAYDSLDCGHQKCLVHLIRDINDDMKRHPYDAELHFIAKEFGGLLASIVGTIDRWGLKAYHLQKHIKQSESLLRRIAGRTFSSVSAQNYQKGFGKYGERLFTFLRHDGVPWNNNNAEHAVHYFAKLRRFNDGMFTKRSLEDLLRIVSVLQTCEYNDVSPLKFLLSGRTDLAPSVKELDPCLDYADSAAGPGLLPTPSPMLTPHDPALCIPLGWLCTKTTAAAASRTTGANTSRGCAILSSSLGVSP